jgi:hypothetical protein
MENHDKDKKMERPLRQDTEAEPPTGAKRLGGGDQQRFEFLGHLVDRQHRQVGADQDEVKVVVQDLQGHSQDI